MRIGKLKKKLTISQYMWRYFAFFSVIIFSLLWVLQIMMFKTYYETMKEHEISIVGTTIAENFQKSSDVTFDKSDMKKLERAFKHRYFEAGKTAFESGVQLYMFDNGGKQIVFDDRPHSGAQLESNEVYEIAKKIKNGDYGRTFKLRDGNFKTNIIGMISSAYLNGKRIFFYIKAPMMPLDTTVRVLQSQLFLVTIASLIIAIVTAYFASKSLARPIKKMTDSANILATGNYDVNFEGTKYLEICELSDALNYAAHELSKTDTLRRDLMANVSHDLKTPLTIIKSYAEMIRDLSGENPKKRNEHTQVIIDETDRLTDLVSDILDLSKLESGTDSMKNEIFDLGSAALSVVDGFRIYEENEGFTFETDIDENSFVYADKRRISQVIYNLMNNAVNYTGDEKKVYVKVKKLSDKVRFEVKDTGEGIDESEIDKVWDRYYKSSKTHKRISKGTGIGLSIVKNILTEHGAKFGVTSEKKKGSTFWFELLREER